jgi:biotin carboxylase
MTPTLLILGAGESQLPTYRGARRLGYRVVGVDRRADAEAKPLCDRFLPVSTANPRRIIAALGDTHPAGVMAPASDPSVPVQRSLGLAYRTPFVTPPGAVRASSDKAWFRWLLDRLGLPRYGWVDGTSEVEVAAKATARLRLPMIVKPVDAAGSRGVVQVQEPGELVGAIREARAWSPRGRVIVEEFVNGRHFSVEAFLEDGRMAVMAVSERTVTGPPSFITVSHLLPAELHPATAERVRRQVELVCAAMGLRQGPVNLDLVVDDRDEAYLVELGARLGGNGLGRLIARTLGVNLVEPAIRLAVGERVRLRRTRRPRHRAGIVYALHAPHRGTLAVVQGAEAVRRIPEVHDLELHATVGSTVHPYDQAAHKLGYLTLVGDSPAQVRSALTRALATLRLDVTQGAEPCTTTRVLRPR